jgi:tetratricopeptide (TPR) repeat protein
MADRKTKEPELTAAQAVELFEKAVADNPRDAQGHLNLGSGYYALGNFEAAFREFQQAAALAPSLGHAHYYLGVLYAKRGEKEKARQEFEEVLNSSAHTLLKNQAKIQNELMNK